MSMPFIQFIAGGVQDVMSQVGQQQQQAQSVLQNIQSMVPKVQNAWVGDDANEFAADVARKIVPAMMELIAAIAGVNLNLTKATDVMNSADSKVKGLADGLGDVFSKI